LEAKRAQPEEDQAKAPAAAGCKSDSEPLALPCACQWTATFDMIGNENELPLQYPPQVADCATIWVLRGWKEDPTVIRTFFVKRIIEMKRKMKECWLRRPPHV
jgi:hypothetical protein